MTLTRSDDHARSSARLGGVRVASVDASHHTMPADRLLRYLEIKVHHAIQRRRWRRIDVVGAYDRSCAVSELEKDDKQFNHERPTAAHSGDSLELRCFPGRDYVHHYGLVVATYLEMTGTRDTEVRVHLPGEATMRRALEQLRLDLSVTELVVVGWGLDAFTDRTGWVSGPGFASKQDRLGGVPVTYLGFAHSIWGDVAGRVVQRLAELGATRVVYVGKVGGLDPAVEPNTTLATGSRSLLGAELVEWRDFFGGTLGDVDGVIEGLHVSSPSILLEDVDWLADQPPEASFVDPEIGWMGRAAADADIEFGYLHVISNNLALPFDQDLSNERGADVVARRRRLTGHIRELVAARLSGGSAASPALG